MRGLGFVELSSDFAVGIGLAAGITWLVMRKL
jgi:hypothetical protein